MLIGLFSAFGGIDMDIKKSIVSLLAAAALVLSPAAAALRDTASVQLTAIAESTSAADYSELLEKCRGYTGYNDLGKQTNGEALQEFYDRLYDIAASVWTSGKDYTTATEVSGNDSYLVDKANFYELGLTASEARCCYSALKYDNPVMYYIRIGNAGASDGKNLYVELFPDCIMAADRAGYQKQIYDYVIKMTKPLGSMTKRFERALVLHDKILPQLVYNSEDKKASYSHSILGTVVYGKGVCECYAKTYQMLLNYIDIDNCFVVGKDLTKGEGHAWNMVKMDNGSYYFVDATWDDHADTHKYFAKGYTVFNDNHAVRAANMSAGDYFYALPTPAPDTDYNCQANSPTLYNIMQSYSFYITESDTIAITKYLGTQSKAVIPETVLGFPVTEIAADAFLNKPTLTEVVLPDSLTTVGSGAFFHTLTSYSAAKITIPKSVTSIGDYAFGWEASKYGSYNNDGNYSAFSPVKITGFTIYCYSGSAAYRYAVNNGFKYVLLDAAKAGDADGSGEVDVSDALMIQQHIAGWVVPIDLVAADVDCNDDVSVQDVLLIQQHIAGWDVKLGAA